MPAPAIDRHSGVKRLHGRADEALVLKEVESAGGQKVHIPLVSLTVALLMG